jgi:hypothetical protein
MNLYFVDSDEAMKQADEEINASSLQFLRSFTCFIASNFYSALNASSTLLFLYEKSSFNASSPLFFKSDLLLNASSPLLFKVTLPTSASGGLFSGVLGCVSIRRNFPQKKR